MLDIKNLIIIIKLLLIFAILAKCVRNWEYELISIENINETPDVMFVNLTMVRVSRGVFRGGGYIHLKQNATDDLHISAQAYFNPTGSNDFILTPFHIPEMTLSSFLNTVYKDVLMETALECITNAPNFKDKFVPPLTERVLTYNTCHADNENLPSVLKTGYYKVVFNFLKQANCSVIYIVEVVPT